MQKANSMCFSVVQTDKKKKTVVNIPCPYRPSHRLRNNYQEKTLNRVKKKNYNKADGRAKVAEKTRMLRTIMC